MNLQIVYISNRDKQRLKNRPAAVLDTSFFIFAGKGCIFRVGKI